jgi:hypothetical protein
MGHGKIEDLVCIWHENNSNQNNGESEIQKPEMCNWKIVKQLEDVKVEFFCPQGWGLHGITPIWYHKSPKLNPLVSKRNHPKFNPLVSKQNHPKLNPLVSKQNPCRVLYG